MATVTVLTPTIPGREDFLSRALESVEKQTRQPDDVHVEKDPFRTGAGSTRNRGLRHVLTDYVAFLDDDDTFLENHVESLMRVAEERPEVDVVYPVPEFVGHHPESIRVGLDGKLVSPWYRPFTEEHRRFLICNNNFIPVTTLVKTSKIRRVKGFPEPGDSDARLSHAEDWIMFRRLALKGAEFFHLPEVTWRWVQGDWHTEGRGLTQG